ncbi:MAG: MFS transporter [Pirellulaceae bacterium]|nr:MFS transporter [Pirellulaceae bacterium]
MPAEKRNFITTTIYQVLLRVGWIFKTESVIIPAALDSIGGVGWMRGCLPMLNRIGQSFPTLLIWPLIKNAGRQRNWLCATTTLMGVLFCASSVIWLADLQSTGSLAQTLFLFIYALFFVAVGINQLALSSLIGKLIRADLRGRLMLAANTLGCLFSVAAAWLVLRNWLTTSEADFGAIFGTSGLLFILAGLSALLIKESPNAKISEERYHLKSILNDVRMTFVGDRHFRVLLIISGLFGLSMTLMPHYQSLGRSRLHLGFEDLLPWLIIQNIGVAVFSVPVGSVADRLGNRAALRLVMSILIAAPILALFFSQWGVLGRTGFMGVYFLLGLMPVTMRVLANYSLEFTEQENHPRYLVTQSIAMAVPVILTSALVGFLIDRLGYDWVFGGVVGCMIIAWCLTFRLHEPRVFEDGTRLDDKEKRSV